jgi:hypothetical protein
MKDLLFKIKINYRVFRYTTSKRYAAKWDKKHYVPIKDLTWLDGPTMDLLRNGNSLIMIDETNTTPIKYTNYNKIH